MNVFVKKTGGGAFDPTDRHIYFRPNNPIDLFVTYPHHRYVLIAVNEFQEAGVWAVDAMTELLETDPQARVFLDSGVFSLASSYAAERGITHDEALRVPLHQLPGFNELWDMYIALVRKWADKLWGYVEIDLGGMEQKKKTRAKLEGMGLRPIPVLHPLNDGWEYFDELATQYDRICIGNVVKAPRPVRNRILRIAYEKKRKYPHLWIHMLGMTASPLFNAFPMDSCDSIYWLRAIKWVTSWKEEAILRPITGFERGYYYKLGDVKTWELAKCLSAEQSLAKQCHWRQSVKVGYRAPGIRV